MGILIFEMLCGFTPFWDSGSPVKIYENILRGKVKYPPYLHDDAVDLLSQLITADLTKRLGNLHGGSDDVKHHAWFAEVTWDRLARKDIDAPYIPPIRGGQGDASQYDKYPEETDHYGHEGEDAYVLLFSDARPWLIHRIDMAIFSPTSNRACTIYDEMIGPRAGRSRRENRSDIYTETHFLILDRILKQLESNVLLFFSTYKEDVLVIWPL